jgi:hypothetical protein
MTDIEPTEILKALEKIHSIIREKHANALQHQADTAYCLDSIAQIVESQSKRIDFLEKLVSEMRITHYNKLNRPDLKR